MATKKAAANKMTAPAAVKTSNSPAKKTPAAKKMMKSELIQLAAEEMELSTKQVAGFFDFLATTAIQETKRSGEFTIPGLGKFVLAQRAARMGRNPQTGEAIKIKAKTAVKFRVAKVAKDLIAPPK